MINSWEKIYRKRGFRHKNKWPNNEVISFLMSKYGKIKNKKKIKILELGFGWGNNLRFFKEMNFDYYGIEQSQTAYRYCKLSHKNTFCGDFIELPFKNNFFDVVIDRQSVQHNSKNNIKKIFQEVNRVLKKDSYLHTHLIGKKTKYDTFTTYFDKTLIKKSLGNYEVIDISKVSSYDISSKNRIKYELYIVNAKK